MEIKKSKVLVCEFKRERENEYDPKEKFYDFWVEFEDGTKGFYTAKKSTPKFVVGQEHPYETEPRKSKEGKPWTKVHYPFEKRDKPQPSFKPTTPETITTKALVDAAAFSASYAKDLAMGIGGGKPILKEEQILPFAQGINNFIVKNIRNNIKEPFEPFKIIEDEK